MSKFEVGYKCVSDDGEVITIKSSIFVPELGEHGLYTYETLTTNTEFNHMINVSEDIIQNMRCYNSDSY
jgi:hypothetical protein